MRRGGGGDRKAYQEVHYHHLKPQVGLLCSYNSKDDRSLIIVTGMDHYAFNELLRLYRPYFDNYSPWTGKEDGRTFRKLDLEVSKGRGRNRIINVEASLGLVLAWYRFRGAEWILQGWFGFTGTHTNIWLRFGRRMLLKAMLKHADAAVDFPSDQENTTLKEIVQQRHSSLGDVYCHVDGMKLYLEAADGDDIQSMYYNGWLHDHFVTNLFLFSACGRIIGCVLNTPG